MTRPTPLSGFPEWLPEQRIVEQQVLDSLRSTFELWGFASVQTRAVEPLHQLLRKGEIDNEVYVLQRLQAVRAEDRPSPPAPDQLGLHYDLTVPFARYVSENSARLTFPFRRYQIQQVWRGERPQEGRYREFLQADVDIVDRDSLAFHAEVEVAQVMVEALARLPLPGLRLQVNNRKVVEGFYRGLGLADPLLVMRELDKLDKVGAAGVLARLTGPLGLREAQARACLDLASVKGAAATGSDGFLEAVGRLGVSHPLLAEGLDELARLTEALAGTGNDRVRVEADLRIARGLDYYTGAVFETTMDGFANVGSVCSGGRYDALASDGVSTFPGVGISFGVTRALAPLLSRGVLRASRQAPTCVLVALAAEETRPQAAAVAASLRARDIPAQVAPQALKYGKQIRYADRLGIPYVWFPSPADDQLHEVKDIRSGQQVTADPLSWAPPDDDLRPMLLQPREGTQQ